MTLGQGGWPSKAKCGWCVELRDISPPKAECECKTRRVRCWKSSNARQKLEGSTGSWAAEAICNVSHCNHHYPSKCTRVTIIFPCQSSPRLLKNVPSDGG